MDINSRKEQFSIAYIKTIAAKLGLNPSVDPVDNDSVDLNLTGSNFSDGILRNPVIHIQLKCTSQKLINKDVIKFPLKMKNYNDLRGENVSAPRYLMVLVVPDDLNEWMSFGPNSLTLFNNCYWHSLRFEPEIQNTSKVTIDISTSQRVTAESLLDLMTKASKGEFV